MDGAGCDIYFLSILALVFGLAYIITRLVVVLRDIYRRRTTPGYGKTQCKSSVKTMVVVGSGGHTTEMLRLLDHVSSVYSPRYYIMADSDTMSEEKITEFEKRKTQGNKPKYLICKIPRSREVRQTYTSTVISTLYALLKCVPLVFSIRPDLVLCNGPGTCIPICLLAFFLRVMRIKQTTVIFVESVCRVKTLSLSGRILYYFADHILVQWPSLLKQYPLASYIGRLV